MTLCNKTVELPINSFLAFGWGIAVTNNFNLFPSFCMFSLGWLMVVLNEEGLKPPSPWYQVRGYFPLLQAFILGTTIPDIIAVNEGADAMDVYNKQMKEKAKRIQEEKLADAEFDKKLKNELDLYAGDEAEVIVSSKQRLIDRISINPVLLPFKPTLYPIQKELRKRVLQLRIAKSILTWHERIYAFWLTTLSFIAAAVFYWVQWSFVLKWLLRITVWVVLGPWTAIFARYKFPMEADMTDEERREEMNKRARAKRREAVEASTKIQVQKESALKGKAIARWLYGEYHIRVPRFAEQLCPDMPLPSSFAEAFDPTTSPPVKIKERVYGQYLEGDMIPKREISVDKKTTKRLQEDFFLAEGLGKYFEDSYGYAQFLDVTKVAYLVGYGVAKGRVYTKTSGNSDARLVGFSTLKMASSGLSFGTTLASEIIFFQDEDAFKRFSSGNFELEGGARVTIRRVSAEGTAGTSGVSLLDRVNARKGKDDEEKTIYHRGMAIFVIVKTGMLVDLSVVGQKFSFEAV